MRLLAGLIWLDFKLYDDLERVHVFIIHDLVHIVK